MGQGLHNSSPFPTIRITGKDFDGGKWSSHDGTPRIQHGVKLNILNRESEAYFRLKKDQKPDTLTWGVRGGPHSEGKDVRQYKFYLPISGNKLVFAKEYGPSNHKTYDKIFANNVEKKGFTLFNIQKGDKSGKMGIQITIDSQQKIGMKVRHYNLDKNGDGKADAVKLEAFVNFDDEMGWQRYLEGEDDGTNLKGPGPLIKIYKDDEQDHIRVDNCGTCSKSNHSIYIPGTYNVYELTGAPGKDDRYWPWPNSGSNWKKKASS